MRLINNKLKKGEKIIINAYELFVCDERKIYNLIVIKSKLVELNIAKI